MCDKNKYTAYCRDEYNNKQTVIVVAGNKIEASEIILSNHPKYDVISIFSRQELDIISRKNLNA